MLNVKCSLYERSPEGRQILIVKCHLLKVCSKNIF